MFPSQPQPFTYEEFKAIYSKVPRLTVEVILKAKGGVALSLRKEFSWEGYWHIPGGTVYYKEPIEDALHRVAREELGIEINIIKLLGYIEYPSEQKVRGFGWSVGWAFLCEPQGEIDEELWAKNDIRIFKELPEKSLVEQHPILQLALSQSSALNQDGTDII